MKRHFLSIIMLAATVYGATAQEKILWGGPGSPDGEFDGGLNGWTTVGVKSADATKAANAVFQWTATANAPGGYTAVGSTVLNSASKTNGAVLFNSDVLDSGTGASKAVGSGVAPAPQESELISPKINLKGTKDVTIVFSQLFRNFRSARPRPNPSTAIMYSRDNGVTWSDPISIYVNEQCKTYQYNTQFAPSVVTRVQMPGAGDTENFKVKFSFNGEYYFWLIDDVSIVPMETSNLRANLNFYAPAENLFTPITQTRETYFLNDIANIGSKPQTNVRHTMSIYKTNTAGQLIQPAVFKDTLKYGTVATDTTVENIPFPNGFLHTGVKSNYAGIYELISDSTDVEPWNNRLSVVFGISDSTFAKDNGRSRSVAPILDPGELTFGYGNVFYVKNGNNFKSGQITFGVDSGADNVGESIQVYLYKWSDDNNDKKLDESELEVIGENVYEIKGTEVAAAQNNVRIGLNNFTSAGQPITLEDNTYYVAYVEHEAKTNDNPVFLAAYDRYDYAASNLAFEGLGKLGFHSILKIGSDFIVGGFTSLVPTIRWNIKTIVDDKEPLLAENTVALAPNPATNNINVKFAFETTMKEVEITVLDVNGREVMNANFNNIQNDNYNLDITALQAGVYNLLVRTETGVTAKSFVVQK